MRSALNAPWIVPSILALALTGACARPAPLAVEAGKTYRHVPQDGSPAYWAFEVVAGPTDPHLRDVRSGGAEGTAWVVGPAGTSDAEAHRYHVVARSRKAPPSRVVLDLGAEEKEIAVSVDWAEISSHRDLPVIWKEGMRDRFQPLRRDEVLGPFARFALDRLGGEEVRASRDLMRAQGVRRRASLSDLNLVTGALAIEESLQLERFRGTGRKRELSREIPISTIQGVTVRSHPWHEMLAGRRPEPHPIERFIPADQYSFESASFASLIELADWLEEYGTPLVQWMESSATDAGVRERIERQLCLPASTIARTLGPYVIRRVAATGGDPFFREGTDLTLIFEVKSRTAFLANLEKNRQVAESERPDCERRELRHGEHEIRSLASPRREVSSHSVVVGDHVLVSNSVAGLRRALDAHDGKIRTQADLLDRRYMRTLLPRDDKESAFIYLSDDAIRALVAPELKIGENRRLECSTSLRAIAHATAFRHLRGEETARSLDELLGQGDLEERFLFCPDGGAYSLLERGDAGRCSVHGTLEFLTPNREVSVERVTEEEKSVYERFRRTYQRYWTRFFDPIGMKIELGKTRRVETVILPLIEMSEYNDLADLFGGEGAQRGPLVEPREDSALVASFHLNRESSLLGTAEQSVRSFGFRAGILGWLGDRVSFFAGDLQEDVDPEPVEDLDDFFSVARNSFLEGQGGGIRIEVRNPLLLGGFLAFVKTTVTQAMPTLRYETLPAHEGIELVRVHNTEPGAFGPNELFYGVIGSGLWISLDRRTLERAIERHRRLAASKEEGSDPAPDAGPSTSGAESGTASWIDGTNMALGLDLTRAPRWRELLALSYEKRSAELCSESRERRELLERLGRGSVASRRSLVGADPCCPLGGSHSTGDLGAIACSHEEDGGPKGSPVNPLRELDRARATLRFTEDGLRTTVEIEERGTP